MGLRGQRPTLFPTREWDKACTLLWVKAKPSGLVTISRRISMESRMAVRVESWP